MAGFFAVFFKLGPQWIPGKSIFEQPLDDHVAYLRDLFDRQKGLMAGPLSDSAGGLTILQADDEAEARTLIAQDPAVIHQILQAELHPWSPIAWDHSDETRVLYEVPLLRTTRGQNRPVVRTW